MVKYTRSAKVLRKKQNRTVSFFLALILLAIAIVVILPRISGGSGGDADLLVANQEVTVAGAYQLYQDGVYTLDVRTPEEYSAGHIPDAALIPLDQLAIRAGELPMDEPILIYCRSGNRSLEAMNMLEDAGFSGLYSMDGGFNDWVEAGYPAEIGE